MRILLRIGTTGLCSEREKKKTHVGEAEGRKWKPAAGSRSHVQVQAASWALALVAASVGGRYVAVVPIWPCIERCRQSKHRCVLEDGKISCMAFLHRRFNVRTPNFVDGKGEKVQQAPRQLATCASCRWYK